MKKKALKAALAFFICWVFFVALEGLLLIGSTDPGKAPLIVLGGAHIADEIDAYCCFANKLRKFFKQSAKKKRRLKGF